MNISYKLGIDTYIEGRDESFDINSAGYVEGYIRRLDFLEQLINSDLLLIFSSNNNRKVRINATIDHNYLWRYGRFRSAEGSNLGAPGFLHLSNATNLMAWEEVAERKLFGVFADIHLSMENYLFLNISARNDWSSTLPEANNSYFYPAVSLGWIFTENLGLVANPYFSYGKIRISWGTVGNDCPIYVTKDYFVQGYIRGSYVSGIPFPAFGLNAFERNYLLGNPDLRPELTTTFETGAEFKFFQERLGMDITYYNTETANQIMDVNLAPSSGYRSVTKNAGKIKNSGWELMMNALLVKGRNFNWDMNINFTKYKSLVEALDPSIDEGGIYLAGFPSMASSRALVGEPYGVLYGKRYQRVEEGPNSGKLVIGENGWPLVDQDPGIIGDPNPDWLLGLRNTFSWKGITLSALLDIRWGGDMWNGFGIEYFGMPNTTSYSISLSLGF
jgi:outer membrane receptor protein involved in Fe transport